MQIDLRPQWGVAQHPEALLILLYGGGQRKSTAPIERHRFLCFAEGARPKAHTLCLTLGLTGCRTSDHDGIQAQYLRPHVISHDST